MPYLRLHLETAGKVGPSRTNSYVKVASSALQILIIFDMGRTSHRSHLTFMAPLHSLSLSLSLIYMRKHPFFSFSHIQIATNSHPSGQKPFPSFHPSGEFQSILFSPSNETLPQHSGELHRFGTPEDQRVYVLQLHIQSLSTDRGPVLLMSHKLRET